jgi:UDP-sulfoquinovose synthase
VADRHALLNRGHEVHAVDNYLRRRAHAEAGTDSLTPIGASLPARAEAWKEVSGKTIGVTRGDLTDWDGRGAGLPRVPAEAIVHYGEMPSAPYSMIDREHAVFTQHEQRGEHDERAVAMRDLAPEAHLVKLGTMGEYGTPNIDIEEGYIEIAHNGRRTRCRSRRCRVDLPPVEGARLAQHPLRVPHLGPAATDLNQGVVYGIRTEETALDDGC